MPAEFGDVQSAEAIHGNVARGVELSCRRGAAIACKPTSTRYVPNKGPRYTCAPDGGRNVNGAILVQPYPQGFKLLQVMLPPQDDQIADQILSGFHA